MTKKGIKTKITIDKKFDNVKTYLNKKKNIAKGSPNHQSDLELGQVDNMTFFLYFFMLGT